MRWWVAVMAGTLAFGASTTGAQARAALWAANGAYAEYTLRTEYETVDPWALVDARQQLATDWQIGDPSAISDDQRSVITAKRAATPDWAHCRGVGAHSGLRYHRLYCTVHVSSSASGYEATKRLTFVVTGSSAYRISSGWR